MAYINLKRNHETVANNTNNSNNNNVDQMPHILFDRTTITRIMSPRQPELVDKWLIPEKKKAGVAIE